MELSKAYNPKNVEERIYKLWLKSGFFNPDNLPGKRKKTYTIVLPPPNITGSLHMGHALNATVQDILIWIQESPPVLLMGEHTCLLFDSEKRFLRLLWLNR